MSAFLAAAFAFPTVVFTALVMAFLVYALLMALGVLELDSLDNLFGLDATEAAHAGAFETTLNALGVQGVPLTVFGSFAVVFAWLLSYFAMSFIGDSGVVVESLVGLGALTGGAIAGALAARPFRGIFTSETAQARGSLVGKTCTIRSLRVDENSGTAEIDDGAAGVIAEVRCSLENQLTRDTKALVYDYDSATGIYRVVPLEATPELETTQTQTDAAPPLTGPRGEVAQ